jgi:glycine cleavage system regulatory protein
MRTPIVMTVIGPDRPGLVELLASTVASHGGNWLQSRMAHLGGHFAGILRLEIPPDRQPGLITALQQLSAQGLTVVCHPDAAVPHVAPTSARLEVLGHDRPGIVQQVSNALARHRINVEELETDLQSAPMTGEPLFHAEAKLRLPEDCDLPGLQSELEKIAADFMVDLQFRTLETPADAAD